MTRTLVAVLVVLAAVTGSAAAGPTPSAADGTPVVAQAEGDPVTTTPQNNTTVQHKNPESVESGGDAGQVTGWLVQRMASRLNASSLQLSQGQYEAASEALGEQYQDYLAKYVEVAGDTPSEADDRTAERLQEARREQREYVQAVREYRQTWAAYQAAKQAGNETRARRIARNLTDTAAVIDRTGENLITTFRRLGNRTGTRLTNETQVVRNVTQNITAQQQAILRAEFVATRLSVAAPRAAVSFTDPLRLTGTLTRANGTRLANRTVTLAVGDRRYRVPVDAQGAFALRYRPVGLPVAAANVTVRYLPRATSVYLASNGTVPVAVEPTTPSVRVRANDTRVGYGDVVRVTSTVTVNGTPVPAVPLAVRLAGPANGTVVTRANGTATAVVRIGAAVPSGPQTLSARVAQRNRAIAAARATTALTVVETPTRLAFDATATDAGVLLAGRLTTADGRPVPGQAVTLRLTESQAITVRTNATGHFRALTRPETYTPGATASITATYAGRTTNLAGASATASVAVPAQTTLTEYIPASGNPVVWGAIFVLALGGAAAVLRYRRTRTDATPATPPASDTTAAAADSESTTGVGDMPDGVTAALDAGDGGRAVQRLYPWVRRLYAARYGLDDAAAGTHWEFYRAARGGDLDDDALATLRDLTERYEQATYAETAVDPAAVRAALDALPAPEPAATDSH